MLDNSSAEVALMNINASILVCIMLMSLVSLAQSVEVLKSVYKIWGQVHIARHIPPHGPNDVGMTALPTSDTSRS